MMKKLAFLHTSPVHIKTFDDLVASRQHNIEVEHIVVEELLDRARTEGLTAELRTDVQKFVRQAVENEADVVLCTCSTIGNLAEETTMLVNKPVLRLDRPMAEKAVAVGSCIIVAATVASTFEPTSSLIREAAQQADKSVEIIEWLCESAWAKFAGGDQAGYLQEIALSLQEAADQGDVIVLAQGSMASAAALCGDLPIPILTSPNLGLEAALAKLNLNLNAPIE